MSEELMKLKEYGSQSGTEYVFVVEVRGVLDIPFEFNGFIVTSMWQRYPFSVVRCDDPNFHRGRIGEIGVTNFSPIADYNHFVNFEAAYAMACTLQTQTGYFNGNSLRTRLVKIELKYKWTAKEAEVSEEISLFDLRRSIRFTNPEAKEPL